MGLFSRFILEITVTESCIDQIRVSSLSLIFMFSFENPLMQRALGTRLFLTLLHIQEERYLRKQKPVWNVLGCSFACVLRHRSKTSNSHFLLSRDSGQCCHTSHTGNLKFKRSWKVSTVVFSLLMLHQSYARFTKEQL